MSFVVPEHWMTPSDSVRGVINHWTAGGYFASDTDLEHYHILIEGDGRLVRGDHSIEDNLNTADGDYAAHTRLCNTGYVGVSACCMRDANEEPFIKGLSPMTEKQWQAQVLVNADLIREYELEVNKRTVLFHGEVEKFLLKPQRGKWDIFAFHLFPGKSRWEIGDIFREQVRGAILYRPDVATQDKPIRVIIHGTAGPSPEVIIDDAYIRGGKAYVPVRAALSALGHRIEVVTLTYVMFHKNGNPVFLPIEKRGGVGYTRVVDLKSVFGLKAQWSEEERLVRISS